MSRHFGTNSAKWTNTVASTLLLKTRCIFASMTTYRITWSHIMTYCVALYCIHIYAVGWPTAAYEVCSISNEKISGETQNMNWSKCYFMVNYTYICWIQCQIANFLSLQVWVQHCTQCKMFDPGCVKSWQKNRATLRHQTFCFKLYKTKQKVLEMLQEAKLQYIAL